ncbi:MAG: DUF1190 domain-containing protein [Rhodoferax sp.]|nr:DUF1190 domain-containing protein [Pseudorhodobacter sp.]
MRKRSHRVALCILGVAAFSLSACVEEEVDAAAFPDLAACKATAALGTQGFSATDCDTAFAEAEVIHAEAAPRYDSLTVCEEQHGEGACDEQVASGGGGGGIFMPLMAGYLIGNMLNRNGPAAQPLYRSASGNFTNAAGTTSYASNSGAGKLGATQFARPATTIGKAPMTAASVQSRGGFGGSAAGRSTGG